MGKVIQELWTFFIVVVGHGQAVITGGVVMAGLAVYERRKKKSIPWRYFLCLLAVFALYSFFAAWQDEHRNAEGANQEKVKQTSLASFCLQGRQVEGAYARGLETSLMNQRQLLDAQQKNVASCVISLGKMNPQITRQTRVILYQFQAINLRTHSQNPEKEGDPDNAFSSLVVITTNQIEPKSSGIFRCVADFDILNEPNITSVDAAHFIGGSFARANGREDTIHFEHSFASWGPTTPIFLTIRTGKDHLRDCTFTPE